MKLPFSLFLALRYLQPKRTFVSTITIISIIGVVLGIAVLIVVMGVMTGFDRELKRKIIGFEPHIIITPLNGLLEDWPTLAKKVALDPDVEGVAPFVQGPVLAQYNGRVLAPSIRAVLLDKESQVVDFSKYTVPTGADLTGDSVIPGKSLSDAFGLHTGDTVTIYAPGNLEGVLREIQQVEEKKSSLDDLKQMILPSELTVTGTFETGRFQYDSQYLLIPLHIGQELYSLGDAVHGLSVRTRDPFTAGATAQRLQTTLPPGYRVSTWMDLNGQFLQAVQLERTTMFFILFFIMIVAAFGIMNTQITVTVQKTREIGILKAVGATTAQIVWVFLGQGMVIAIFGNILGVLSGLLILHYRNELLAVLAATFHIEIFPRQVYQFSELPAELVTSDLLIICVSAFIVCTLAALLPAWAAARLDPVKALRHE